MKVLFELNDENDRVIDFKITYFTEYATSDDIDHEFYRWIASRYANAGWAVLPYDKELESV